MRGLMRRIMFQAESTGRLRWNTSESKKRKIKCMALYKFEDFSAEIQIKTEVNQGTGL